MASDLCPTCGSVVGSLSIETLKNSLTDTLLNRLWGGWDASPVVLGFGVATFVDKTGGEDQGSQLSVTFQLQGRFFRVEGYYDSYDANEWYIHDAHEVMPQTREVVIYDRI
jgi:hypothetical protein